MMNEQQPDTFEVDGTRPIKNTDLEIADTFQEDGERPIAESPDFLTNNRPSTAKSINKTKLKQKTNKTSTTASSHLVVEGDVEIVNTSNIARSDRVAEPSAHRHIERSL